MSTSSPNTQIPQHNIQTDPFGTTDLYGSAYLTKQYWHKKQMTQNIPDLFPETWASGTTTIRDSVYTPHRNTAIEERIRELFNFAHISSYIKDNTGIINGKLIFSEGDHLEKFDLPKEFDVSSTIALLQWCATLDLLLK